MIVFILMAIIGRDRPARATNYTFQKIVGGFSYPLAVATAPGDSQSIFVAQLFGKIRIVRGGVILPEPFLDLTALVSTKVYGQGLYDLAFDPDYVRNGFVYVDYVNQAGDPVLARYTRSALNPDMADPTSAKILLTIPHPHGFHYGGQLAFGPDGYMYYSTGDGGSPLDSDGNAQNKNSLLGALLRIDVSQVGTNGSPYRIPPDNPVCFHAVGPSRTVGERAA
jgi:glucose/arabinose dehydrogenase